jgi:hypothetical protein
MHAKDRCALGGLCLVDVRGRLTASGVLRYDRLVRLMTNVNSDLTGADEVCSSAGSAFTGAARYVQPYEIPSRRWTSAPPADVKHEDRRPMT